jgi:exocyst complex component 8
MYNTQLQALWKNIEGSQKFLAAMPGRHIVLESGHWAELDGATLKPRRNVHIVLLNDHLLIAARKPKRLDTNDPKSRRPHTKLVAVRCWPMNEIDMVEVRAPSRDAEDALAIRHGQESYTFAGDRGNPKDQVELLQAFRRTKDELRRTERAANGTQDVKNKETNDYLAVRDPAISQNPGLLGSLSRAKNQPEVLIDVDGKQRNLRWVEGQIDELDIEVALQRFEEAVSHVEQLRKLAKGLKGNTVAQEVITVKVDERATKLAGSSYFIFLISSR